MNNKKKKIAAVSAVLAYIRSEEDALSLQAQASVVQPLKPPVPVKMWSISGRQAQMQMQNIMQMKGFHKSVK